MDRDLTGQLGGFVDHFGFRFGHAGDIAEHRAVEQFNILRQIADMAAEILAQRLQSLPGVPNWDRAQARAWWNLHHPADPAKMRLSADTAAVKVVLPAR